MDGLEVSEVKLSDLEKTKRIDSEFYKKENLKIDKLLENLEFEFLNNIVNVSDGNHMAISDEFVEKGIPYYRGQDIHNFFIEQSQPICITKKAYEKSTMKRSYLKKDDILLSIVGTIGKLSIVSENKKATCNCKLAILRTHSINNKYLSIFLSSKLGQNQIKKFTRGAVQMGLILEDMSQIKIPMFSNSFQSKIESLVKLSHQKLEESKTLYKQAEEILLKELDLLNFEPSKENVSIKSFSESFLVSERFDAEYYQPKYDEIIDKIKSYRDGFETINKACNLEDKNFILKDKQKYKYIELSNIGTTGDITGFTFEFGEDLPTRARRIVKKGDVIVSSIEGSLEKVALVTKNFDNSLCSTGFYVINSNRINSETLLVLFKNRIFREILKQNCSGTILTAINKDEFLNIIIPIIDKQIQIQISNKIQTSFNLREESKSLLETAKRAVEIAIEESEAEAIKFIEEM